MTFGPGNTWGRRSRLFEKALTRAIEEDRTSLDRIAKHLLNLCEDPNAAIALPAINLLANRLDGKPHQTMENSVDHTVNTGNAASLTERLAAAALKRTTPGSSVQ
jgi:hypothetical protein